MGLFEGVKDVAGIVQKIGNIELYQKILDIEAQALDLQDELAKLKSENRELKEQKNISDKIKRHNFLYLTLNDDPQELSYCTHCWDSQQKLIQLETCQNNKYYCPHCHYMGTFENSIEFLERKQKDYNYDPYKSL